MKKALLTLSSFMALSMFGEQAQAASLISTHHMTLEVSKIGAGKFHVNATDFQHTDKDHPHNQHLEDLHAKRPEHAVHDEAVMNAKSKGETATLHVGLSLEADKAGAPPVASVNKVEPLGAVSKIDIKPVQDHLMNFRGPVMKLWEPLHMGGGFGSGMFAVN